jgi:hypothetical protein
MAVLHIVWLRFGDGVPDERIERHLGACRGFVGRIPGVLDVKCGASFTNRAGGFTHGLVVTLSDRNAVRTYLDHPEHRSLLEVLLPDVAELRAMDLEV